MTNTPSGAGPAPAQKPLRTNDFFTKISLILQRFLLVKSNSDILYVRYTTKINSDISDIGLVHCHTHSVDSVLEGRLEMMISLTQFPRLYRGDVSYSLNVFGMYPDNTWDVEVFVEDDLTPRGTYTVYRNTHIIGDVFDNVTECVNAWLEENGY